MDLQVYQIENEADNKSDNIKLATTKRKQATASSKHTTSLRKQSTASKKQSTASKKLITALRQQATASKEQSNFIEETSYCLIHNSRNLEIMCLIGELHPDYWTICEFRRKNEEQIKFVIN